MSENITVTNGVAEMVSGMGITPWHKQGTVIPGLMTATEAMALAHLNWQVAFAQVFVGGKEVPGYQATVRADTGDTLGIMRDRYNIIQNAEAFSFFDNIVGKGKATYETAGSLRGGKIVWLMAKYNGDVSINQEAHKEYCLLVTGHDGRYSLMLQWVSVRVVCANTLSLALNGASNQIKIRHTANWQDKETEAKRVLGLTEDYFTALRRNMAGLNEKLLTVQQMSDFTDALIPCGGVKPSTRTANIRAEINRLFGSGAGNHGASRWDALQAVSDYADHSLPIRGENSTRMESSMLGTAQALKQKAWDYLTSEDLMAQLLSAPARIVDRPVSNSSDFARLLGN
jgi:phage/plasmid-like protein (TIGR03299 family)